MIEQLLNHFEDDKGSFLQMGHICSYVLSEAGKEATIAQIAPGCMSNEEAQVAAHVPTLIRKLSREEFERLFSPGFQLADHALFTYHSDHFAYIGYANRIGR